MRNPIEIRKELSHLQTTISMFDNAYANEISLRIFRNENCIDVIHLQGTDQEAGELGFKYISQRLSEMESKVDALKQQLEKHFKLRI